MKSVASTTLLTFRVDVPSDAFSVELRGSWDNFNHSYHLQQDPRRSPSNWVGIFTFKDIICHADSDRPATKREGCLSMGGTYWYHYLVNGVYEFCDQAQPSTTRCPFLPGEDLNVLHVPWEEAADVLQDELADLSAHTPAFTWNPQARYSTPRPNKFEALARKAQPPPPSPSYPSPVTPSCENPASFDFFPAQSPKRPSIRKSPDGNDRPHSTTPSAPSDSRPWTSSDDNSMKAACVREKTSQLLRRARSLTTIARKISQKQRKRGSPEATSTPSSVPEPIEEQSTEDLPMAYQKIENGRNASTSNGTVGCWAHQDCWQSAGPRTYWSDEEASRNDKVASWMEEHGSPDRFHDNFADPWSRQGRVETGGLEQASTNRRSDEYSLTGNDETEHRSQRRLCRPCSRTSQSPISPRRSFDWIHLPGKEQKFRRYSALLAQSQQEGSIGAQHDAAPQRVSSRQRRLSYGRSLLPSNSDDPTAPFSEDFLYDPWGGVGNHEVQDSNPGLEYAYSDDAYDESDEFSREQDSAYTWGPIEWQPQNMAASDARMIPSHTFQTDGPDHSPTEGDPAVYPDGETENVTSGERCSVQPREFYEQYPDYQSAATEEVQQQSPASDDSPWANAASNHNGPLRRFRSIIERYRHASSCPGSVHTGDETRENNPSTPTQDSCFQGYMLPEEESTSQVTLTKVSTQATVVRQNSFSNAPQLELKLDGGELGDWSSFTSVGELERFGF